MARTPVLAPADSPSLSLRVPRQRGTVTLPTTPSSLVKLSDAERARCPECESPKLTEITMTLTDGSPVRFTACRACEYRAWTQAGQLLGVDSVLAKATKAR